MSLRLGKSVHYYFPTASFHSLSLRFNQIAQSFLRKALQSILNAHFSTVFQHLPKSALDVIVETANGDIRSAIMALQFACIVKLSDKKGKKVLGGRNGARAILDAVTRREQSLALFHLMGKVLYNKSWFCQLIYPSRANLDQKFPILGKGDPPNASARPKDLQRERDLDARLKDAPLHLPFQASHNRRASRVDVDVRMTKFLALLFAVDGDLIRVSCSDIVLGHTDRLVAVLPIHPSKLHTVLQ